MLVRLSILAAMVAALLLPAQASAIVNGTPPTRDYPFMAALEEDDFQICGSSLVAPQWILTAAHCVVDSTPQQLTFQIGGVDYVGSPLDFYEQNDMGERIGATEIIVHEDYQSPESSSNDIALVKLARPSVYPPIKIADPATQKALWAAGEMATVMGYGGPFFQVPSPTSDFQEAKVPMVADADCDESYNGLTAVPFVAGTFEPVTMVCAGNFEGTEDSCQGDSGGPLVVEDGAGGLVQVGVVSWGFACGLPNYYGVYGRVGDSALYNWIQPKIGGSTVERTLEAPSSANLGSVERGRVGDVQTVTVTNAGDSDKSVDSIAIGGADAAAVSLIDDACSGATLAGGATCAIRVALTPIHSGAQAAQMRIASADLDAPLTVALSGTGTDPAPVPGPKGDAGPAGPAGPQGPAGRDATVVCEVTGKKAEEIICRVAYQTTSEASRVYASVTRSGKTYARSKTRKAQRKGSLKLRTLRNMRPGRYTLRLTTLDRQGRRSVLRRAFVVR
jgi:secreted trypsin-like serine protease